MVLPLLLHLATADLLVSSLQGADVIEAVPPADLERQALAASADQAPRLWARAGLAWVEAGDGGRARTALDRALSARPSRSAIGELRLIRARADALLGDIAAARADLDSAIAALPGDTVPLLLSAALARRTGDLTRAHGDVEAAWDLAPDDPLVLLEAGRVALAAGEPADAAVAWRRVLKRGVDDEVAAEARDGLTRLGLKVE